MSQGFTQPYLLWERDRTGLHMRETDCTSPLGLGPAGERSENVELGSTQPALSPERVRLVSQLITQPDLLCERDTGQGYT